MHTNKIHFVVGLYFFPNFYNLKKKKFCVLLTCKMIVNLGTEKYYVIKTTECLGVLGE